MNRNPPPPIELMRRLFSHYRISAALDAAKPLPPSLQQKLTASEELRRFAHDLSALDQALRNSPPRPEPPAALHASIMRTARSAGRPAQPARHLRLLRWLPAPALAALVCALWTWHAAPIRAPSPNPIEIAATTLAGSGEMARTMPAAALAPLTEEWQRLNQDVDATAAFLLATLP